MRPYRADKSLAVWVHSVKIAASSPDTPCTRAGVISIINIIYIVFVCVCVCVNRARSVRVPRFR